MIREMLNNEIDVSFEGSDNGNHYKITPYIFKPDTARKITSESSYDFGQGIIEYINEIYEEVRGEK
jgi:hypothetical protein